LGPKVVSILILTTQWLFETNIVHINGSGFTSANGVFGTTLAPLLIVCLFWNILEIF
jgi:hypothetical protein